MTTPTTETTKPTVDAQVRDLPEAMVKEICERARNEGVIPANPDRGAGPALRWFIIQAWQRQSVSVESVPAEPQGQPVAQDETCAP